MARTKNLRNNISSFLRYTGISQPLYKLRSLRQMERLNKEYGTLLDTGEMNNWIKVEFFLTLECNLSCPMCHQGLYRNRVYNKATKKEMSQDEVKKCIDNLYNSGIHRIWLMGGEIFARSDIFQILNYFKYKGILIDLSTNGILFDKQLIDHLDNYHNINWIEFSLDGLESTHNRIRQSKDAFAKTLEAIKLINLKRNFSTTVTFVLQKDNIDELKPTVDLCRNFGVREFNVTMRMFYTLQDLESSARILGINPERLSVGMGSSRQEEYPYSKFKEALDLIPKLNKGSMRVSLFPAIANQFPEDFWRGNVLSMSKRPFCGATKLIVVDCTGDVLLCGFIKKSFGNLLNQPLAEIINSTDFKAFRKQLIKNHLLPICQRCCGLINLS